MNIDLHFIRPWALLLLIPLAIILWLAHRFQDPAQVWRRVIAPHLLPFLLRGQDVRESLTPLPLIGVAGFLATIALAGPTWRREPAPFADDIAALAIVIKVTPSMVTEDVQPSRLACAVHKIHDLLDQRRGAKTALIAYAGTAHRVMPGTTDGAIINTFAQALDPRIMPGDGDAAAAALRLADHALEGAGSILWITDSIASEQASALQSWRSHSRTTVRLLPPLLPGQERDNLNSKAKLVNADLVALTADNSDVLAIAHSAKFATASTAEKSDRWQESGYWLTPLIAGLVLPFFRKGWMLPIAARK